MSVCRFPVCVISGLIVLGAARTSTAGPVVIYSNFGPSPGYLSQVWSSSEENGYAMGLELTESALLRSVTPACDDGAIRNRRWTDAAARTKAPRLTLSEARSLSNRIDR